MTELTPQQEQAIRRDHRLVRIKPYLHGNSKPKPGRPPIKVAGQWVFVCGCGKTSGPRKTKKMALAHHQEHVDELVGNLPPWVRP